MIKIMLKVTVHQHFEADLILKICCIFLSRSPGNGHCVNAHCRTNDDRNTQLL